MEEKFTKLNPTNLNEEQKKEFEKTYRVLSSDVLEMEDWLSKQRFQVKDALDDSVGLEYVLELIEDDDRKELSRIKKYFKGNVKKTKEYISLMSEQIEEYDERVARAKSFFDEFKNDLDIMENGDCVVGEKALFLIEYLHSLGVLLEQEEREKLKQQG